MILLTIALAAVAALGFDIAFLQTSTRAKRSNFWFLISFTSRLRDLLAVRRMGSHRRFSLSTMRTSQTSNFLQSLPIVAGCLGEKLGVSVRFGDAAYTDGKCITLPAFMNEREITREEMLGFIVHEASHIRYTDMDFCLQTNPAPLQKSFINSIEDARIEKLIAEEYAGARHLLRCAHEPLMTEFLNSSAKLNPQSALSLYLLTQCESTYLKDKLLLDVRDVLKKRCLKCFGAPLMAEIDAELSAFPSAADTVQAGAIAGRIYQLLLDQLPPEDNPQQPGAGSSGQKEGEGEEGNNQTSTAQGAPGSQGTQCPQESLNNTDAAEADGSKSASQSPKSQKDSSGQESKSKQKASGNSSDSDSEKGNSSSYSAEA